LEIPRPPGLDCMLMRVRDAFHPPSFWPSIRHVLSFLFAILMLIIINTYFSPTFFLSIFSISSSLSAKSEYVSYFFVFIFSQSFVPLKYQFSFNCVFLPSSSACKPLPFLFFVVAMLFFFNSWCIHDCWFNVSLLWLIIQWCLG